MGRQSLQSRYKAVGWDRGRIVRQIRFGFPGSRWKSCLEPAGEDVDCSLPGGALDTESTHLKIVLHDDGACHPGIAFHCMADFRGKLEINVPYPFTVRIGARLETQDLKKNWQPHNLLILEREPEIGDPAAFV